MSYCVNCGVELAPSEPKCPLCGVEVINPIHPWKEPRSRPYPNYFDEVMRGVDRRYFCLITAVLMMIPVMICLMIDLFSSGDMTWSSYVFGAAVVLMAVVLVPLASSRHRPFRYILVNTAAILGYLMLIDFRFGGMTWFIPLAMPITLSCAGAASVVALYFRKRKRAELLITLAILMFLAGMLTVLIELFIRNYDGVPLLPVWSWYAFVPCALSSVAFLILNKRNRWKESVRKRLFI